MSHHQLFAVSAGRVQADPLGGSNNNLHHAQANAASIAAARRRFASSAIDVDGADTSATASSYVSTADNTARGTRGSPLLSKSNGSASPKAAAAGATPSSPAAIAAAVVAPTFLTERQMRLVSTRGACTSVLYPTSPSTQSAAAASNGREDWTTNLYREFRPNAVIRAVESFERSLTVRNVETRMHALRSLYHCACDGAACRAALRQRLPKLVAAVAAVAAEADATRQGGNRLCDVAFRLLCVMVGDGDARFDTDAVLDDTLMGVVAPRCLLAGGEAAFSAATFLRRASEMASVAHAIVHNDVLLDSVLRVLEEESLWFQEQQHRSMMSSSALLSSGGSNSSANNSPAGNAQQQKQPQPQAQTQAPVGSRSHQPENIAADAVTVDCAATVIQLRIALLNVCSRPTAATFMLVKSQRFVSLLARDGEMGVWASKGLLQRRFAAAPPPTQVAFGERTVSQEAVIFAAAQAATGRPQCIGGAVLEEKLSLELANGKRRLFQPSHIVTFALAGTVFDSAASDAECLSALPSHPSVPSEGGGAIPASRAAHRSTQPLQCRLEAARVVKGEEVGVLAAVSAVLSLRTLHAMCVREGRSEALAAVQPQLVRALAACLAHVGQGAGGNGGAPTATAASPHRSASRSSLESAAAVITAGAPPGSPGAEAAARLLLQLRMAAAAAIDVLEEADSEGMIRRLENFSSGERASINAVVDRLRSNLNDQRRE